MEYDFVACIAEKFLSRIHGLQDALFSLDTQINILTIMPGDKPHEAFRFVGVQSIHDKMPFRGSRI